MEEAATWEEAHQMQAEGILLGKGSRDLPCLSGHRAPSPSFLAFPPFKAATPL